MNPETPEADPVQEPAARKQDTNANAPMPAHQDRLNELREEYAQTGGVLSGGAVWLFGEIARLREQVARQPAPAVQYGFRLRDSTLLDFATKADRAEQEQRKAEAAIARVRVQCAEWARPIKSGSWDAQIRDDIAASCADMILCALDAPAVDEPSPAAPDVVHPGTEQPVSGPQPVDEPAAGGGQVVQTVPIDWSGAGGIFASLLRKYPNAYPENTTKEN